MCDNMPMEFRYTVRERVTSSLIALGLLLVSALFVVGGIALLAEPSRVYAHHGSRVGNFVLVGLVLMSASVQAYGGLLLIGRTLSARLVVTGDGLVSREARWIIMRATTIPWSSVSSFTVKRRGSRRGAVDYVIQAVLDSGQQFELAGTTRRRAVVAEAIAGELTAKLRENHDGARV